MERAVMMIRALRLCQLGCQRMAGRGVQHAAHLSSTGTSRAQMAVGTRTLRTTAEANTTKSRTGNQRPADQERSSVPYMGNEY